MSDLTGKTALVTGATRGVGRGVALELAAAGATVYATGRSVNDQTFDTPNIIPIPCDHTVDAEVEAVFERVKNEHGRLNVLVNNAWGGYENMVENGEFTWMLPFWKQPLWRWDSMMTAGVRAAYVAGVHAARLMAGQGGGLIVNISFWSARKHIGNAIYGISKAATDKMTTDMAYELREQNVAVVSLYPGMVRTEKVMEAAAYLDLSNSESPQFIGRTIAALATDKGLMEKSGEILVAAALAQEYGISDIDGKSPRPLTIKDV